MIVFLVKAAQLILALSILVFIHELGHYLFARLFRVRVDKFYLFFDWGGAIFRYKPKRSDTEFGIGWLPLGGYCKINGMIDESFDTEHLQREPQPYEFRSRPAWQRLLIMLGGVLFNFLLALVIYAGIVFHWGNSQLPSDRITSGMAFSSVAQEAGFRDNDIILTVDGRAADAFAPGFMRSVIQAREVEVMREGRRETLHIPHDMMKRVLKAKSGFMSIQYPFVIDSLAPEGMARAHNLLASDSITAVNGKLMPDLRDVIASIRSHAGDSITISFMRAGVPLTITLPVDTAGTIGITARPIDAVYAVQHIEYSLLEAIPAGIAQGVGTMRSYVSDMKYVFTKEGAQQMGGFGTLGSLFPSSWNWALFWSMTAFLSIMLAVMNILPIPALDGGHILFLLFEIITRRKLSQEVLIRAQMIGLAILFLLMLYANGNDLFRAFR